MKTIVDLFRVDTGNPDLMRAQMQALHSQVPLLYVILAINSTALAVTYLGAAPDRLTLYPLGALLAVCALRLGLWLRRARQPIDETRLAARLWLTVVLAGVLAVGFMAWGCALFGYGDAYARAHMLFYVGTTTIACVFCLAQLRAAALLVTAIVTILFCLHVSSLDNQVMRAIGLNLVIVSAALAFVILTYYRDFTRLIGQQVELGRLSRENLRLANLDMLTELPNRRSFFASLDQAVAEAEAGAGPFVVGLIDLDGFKPVNDAHGHGAGDAVLQEVARRVRDVVGEAGVVARIGGDEFGLVLRGTAALATTGEAICGALAAPFRLPNGGSAQIGASIGFAAYPEAGHKAAQLVERADYALYYAKAQSRGAAVLFTEEHERLLRTQSVIEQALRHADLSREMSLVFQPIVDVRRGRTVAFEALARWTSPELGPVSPAVFVPIAERSGLITRITAVLFGQALAAARAWPDRLALSFNLSMADIASPQAAAGLVAAIRASGLEPERVILEVTETALIQDVAQAQTVLETLKATGIAIALDDFGTGYSSLSYVHRLPLDKLKIDRSFISEVTTDPASRDIVTSIAALARNLKLDCVVEGIETPEQARLLEGLGFVLMQGYHFHRPMGFSDTLRYLDSEAVRAIRPVQGIARQQAVA
ncbi:putative bifunctional diguanylate cyclase/phosphodiesterase [Methylobacterium sp. SyP6R]|uniref:putative bifunctional diguanylate cyclase/phosphodiesterase n=1 Tax=Methylobacterium sp. SyP6R TaxID=2718876 RepID=UPI001F283C08|nr:EAL domain-containing protein [Methylobacterium sp. SyP6R]MCF4128453.1 EAL domain-containing protein [Methylobacterium sp. SyP6R]